jgi:hypothetical protein
MAKFTLDDILNSDPLGLLGEVKAKNPIVTADDRLIVSFEEINSFFEKQGHEPKRSNDMSERKLYARLQGIREDIEKSEQLKKYDRFNLLADLESEALAPNSIEDILESDIFGLLEEDEVDIFTMKNIPKIDKNRADADFVAKRLPCKNFDKYEDLFKHIQQALKSGERKLVDSVESQLKEGTFCVLDGILLYIAKIALGKRGNSNKINRRTLLIFENGTQSNMLLRSLGKRLKESGKMVTEVEGKELEGLRGINSEDRQNGFIYVLKSKSQDDRILTKKNLYKIGFSSQDVNQRIKNAKNEPTYLMAEVEVVAIYEVFNINPQKLEQLLHKFFGNSCLNIEIFDKEGKSHYPREWFIAPLNVIDEVLDLLLSGKIIDYKYNTQLESIVEINY